MSPLTLKWTFWGKVMDLASRFDTIAVISRV